MSANARVAAGRGGRGGTPRKIKTRPPHRKGYTSNHPDTAMKTAVFDAGHVADATQFVKSMEAIVGYVGRSDRHHTDHLRNILTGDLAALPTIPDPTMPTQAEITAEPLRRDIFLDDRKEARKERKKLEMELKQLYDELWEQCSHELKGKIKGENGYEAMEAARNPLELRNRIKQNCCGFEEHRMKYYALAQAIKKLTMFYQKPDMSNEDYKQQFDALWDTVTQFGGSLTNHTELILAEANKIAIRNNRVNAATGAPAPTAPDTAEATVLVNDKMRACFMLGGANDDRFKEMKNWLENQYVMGSDQYPDTEEGLLGMMNNFRMTFAAGGNLGMKRQARLGEEDGVAFVQEGETEEEEDNVEQGATMVQQKKEKMDINAADYPFKDRKCYHCNKVGHIARDCGELSQTERGQIHAQFGVGLFQQNNIIKRNYLYLDTATTDDFCCNDAYLTGVHTAPKSLRLSTNSGSTSTNKQGYMGSLKMWLGNTGIANVISLKSLEKLCHKKGGHLSYRSNQDGGSFVADLGEGTVITFQRCPETDFPYIDLDEHSENGAVMLLQSVNKNMEGYTKREVERAIHARDTQAMMGYVSEQDLKTEG